MESKLILVVEDNPLEVALTTRALRHCQVEHDVVVAHDGTEAIAFLTGVDQYEGRDTSELPNLILLDMRLPDMEGLDVLRHIRSDERMKQVPVVVLTSSSEEDDLVNSYELGANSFVRKPVDFNAFTTVVRQLGLYWLVVNELPTTR